MSHANAALTPRARLRLAKLIIDDGWPVAIAAKMFMVSPPTARKWATRYRDEGTTAMTDRSSRPRSIPTKTPPAVVKQIVKARWRRRLGPAQIAGEVGIPASIVHAVLVRCRINRLGRIDRVTGEPIRRYEHDRPGSLIHVDGLLSDTRDAGLESQLDGYAEFVAERPWAHRLWMAATARDDTLTPVVAAARRRLQELAFERPWDRMDPDERFRSSVWIAAVERSIDEWLFGETLPRTELIHRLTDVAARLGIPAADRH